MLACYYSQYVMRNVRRSLRYTARDFKRVHCRGQYHYVGIIGKSVVVPYHNIKREIELEALNGEQCPCMRLFYKMVGRLTVNGSRLLNAGQIEFANYSITVNRFDCLHPPYEDPEDLRLHKLVYLLLKHRCNYPLLRDNPFILKVSRCSQYRSMKTPSYGVFAREVRQSKRRMLSRLQYPCIYRIALNFQDDWIETVWKSGLAVYEGELVLSIGPAREDYNNREIKVLSNSRLSTLDQWVVGVSEVKRVKFY
jgi:hypothetical protein